MIKKNIIAKFININLFILFFVIVVVIVHGQNDQNSPNNKIVEIIPEQIIEKAKTIINKDIKIKEIKGIYLELQTIRVISTQSKNKLQSNVELSLATNFPNQIRREEYNDHGENQQLTINVLNFPKYSITSDILINGKPFNFSSNLGSIVPTFTKKQRIDSIMRDVFITTFPILLQSSCYQGINFRYVGEVESKDFKAEVIEAIDKDNKKARLFFDKQSHYLLMLTESLLDPNKKEEIERKFYYSDYKEISGLLVAHKIIVQTGDIMTEERQLKKFEINPTFKPNLFEVKEDKINPF